MNNAVSGGGDVALAKPGVVDLTMGEAINMALREALDGEDPVMLLGQDIGPYGGTFGVTRGLYEDFGEDVVRDGPLCGCGRRGCLGSFCPHLI